MKSAALLENHGSYETTTRFGGRKKYVPDARISRPKTIAEARAIIEETFVFNGWNEREQQTYFEQIGVDGTDAPGDVRRIITDMDESKLLLFWK